MTDISDPGRVPPQPTSGPDTPRSQAPAALIWVGVLGVAAVALGVLHGFSPVGDCGSPWSPDTSKVESDQRVDALTNAMAGLPREQQADPALLCDAQFGSRGTLATGLAVLGGVMVAGAVMVRYRGQGASDS
ncbi:hypothetical protein [Streptomyces caniferus]|uniref:hypothetical protein n=1 Tax=Streptomyces caniferus TaxID=285557 RepID=UPI0038207695